MYKIIMLSPGGTKRDFHGNFETEQSAIDFAADYDWEWIDDNGFIWTLDVVEEYEEPVPQGPRELEVPNKEWAETYLKLLDTDVNSALQYLSDAMENSFDRDNRIKYLALRKYVDALVALTVVVTEMEIGEIEYLSEIVDRYNHLMYALELMCERALGD